MNEEELKKCPQCGGPVKHNDHEIGFMCVACEMDLYEGYAEWWCYKEISHLKAALQELHKEICFLSGALQAKDAEIAELKTWLANERASSYSQKNHLEGIIKTNNEKIAELVKALEEIAGEDYRGNRSTASNTAFHALAAHKEGTGK